MIHPPQLLGTRLTTDGYYSNNGAACTPGNAVLRIIDPRGTRFTYDSAMGGAVRIAEGHYRRTGINLNRPGNWILQWSSTGNFAGGGEDQVIPVQSSAFKVAV
jgi:hypothetical protein